MLLLPSLSCTHGRGDEILEQYQGKTFSLCNIFNSYKMIRALDYGIDLIWNSGFFLGIYFNLKSTYFQKKKKKKFSRPRKKKIRSRNIKVESIPSNLVFYIFSQILLSSSLYLNIFQIVSTTYSFPVPLKCKFLIPESECLQPVLLPMQIRTLQNLPGPNFLILDTNR